MKNLSLQKITVFAGHYGSGKTTVAANYAVVLKKRGIDVSVCDLDIVNPYFRTSDFSELFEKHGIKLISSSFANTNLDVPAVTGEVKSVFDSRGPYGIIDLGGDERGAMALGRYADIINGVGGYEMLMVINRFRPLTRNPDALL